MVKFAAIVFSRSKGSVPRGRPVGRRFRKLWICIALAFIFATSSVSMAQGSGGPPPPRPRPVTNPWPWFLAFILLGVTWYPAFKNSKREMER